jgi:hypothetical protein
LKKVVLPAPFGPISETIEPVVRVGGEEEVERAHQEAPGDDPPDVPESADDHHGEHDDRDAEVELPRIDRLENRGVDRPSEPGERGAEAEGEELGRHQIDAHERGGDLILAHRHPGPAEARVAHADAEEDGEQPDRQDQPVPRRLPRIDRPPGDGVAEPPDRIADVVAAEQHRPRHLADAATAVGDLLQVEEGQRHDLAEGEGHDRQVVAAQAEGGCAEEDPEERRDDHADRHRHPERGAEAPLDDRALRRGEEADGVGPDREEGDVAEVEQPGEADDDIQPQRQDDEEGDLHQRQHRLRPERLVEYRVDQRVEGGDRQHDQRRGRDATPRGYRRAACARGCGLCLAHGRLR